jgi:hypothetical protein
MVASLLKIVHTGIQDERLLPPADQPSLKYFQKAFVKAGRFTTQWVRLDFDTRPLLGAQASLTIPRQGHLVSRLYLVTTMPDIYTIQQQAAKAGGANFVGPRFGWTNSLGHALIQEATVEIGGARVESLDSRTLEVLDEFTTPLEKTTVMDRLIKREQNGFTPTTFGWESNPTVAVTPLPFWFSNGDSGVCLPIDALGADFVRLLVRFAPLASLYVSTAQQSLPNLSNPVGGDAYFPLLGSSFYQSNANGMPISGLNGNPTQSQKVSKIPGVQMPNELFLGDTYVMAEYIYLDKVEANFFRISDIQYPVVQHYAFEPFDSLGLPQLTASLRVPNPVRDLYFFAQRREAVAYNAPFLATRDLSGFDVTVAPWWPDASGLTTQVIGDYAAGFSTRDSEPLATIQLLYEGKLIRYESSSPTLFRSVLPAFHQRKTPWINRYYYNMPFGVLNGLTPPSVPSGEGNLDKIKRVELQMQFKPFRGSMNPNNVPRYNVYVFAQTYNIFRVYGGRGGLLFGY